MQKLQKIRKIRRVQDSSIPVCNLKPTRSKNKQKSKQTKIHTKKQECQDGPISVTWDNKQHIYKGSW